MKRYKCTFYLEFENEIPESKISRIEYCIGNVIDNEVYESLYEYNNTNNVELRIEPVN